MQPHASYRNESPEFWALVKYSSGILGYSERRTRANPESSLKQYEQEDLLIIARENNLGGDIATRVLEYLNYRSAVLNNSVRPLFMDRDQARELFERLVDEHSPTCHLPFNKQKGDKRHHSYFSCIINILTEANLGGSSFDDNPRKLTTISDENGRLVQTLSRRIDGAYPGVLNPVAIWEIKEYYGTTTFGSRVADGVYETQLDGYELHEASGLINRHINHYLFVDDRFTWWDCGRSYLCRLMDIMHVGLVDEVIFGREVISRWPDIVSSWPTT